MKILKGDTVLITAGKDKGRSGKIEKVFPQIDRVMVEGLNIYKKARKAVGNKPGGMIEFSRSLPVASVAIICPKCSKQTRVKMKIEKGGDKIRICAKCGEEMEKGGKE